MPMLWRSAVLGVGLAFGGIRVFRLLLGNKLPSFAAVSINFSVLAFALVVAIVAAILVGLVPTLRALRLNLNEPLKESGARRNSLEPVGSTDHLSFIAAGVPGFNPIQDYVNYDVRTHHTNMDTEERATQEPPKDRQTPVGALRSGA